MYSFPNLEPVYCSISSSNYCFLTCIQVSQESGKVIWYSHLFQYFPQFILIHPVKGFGIVQRLWHSQESRNQCFSGTLLLFPWSSGCCQLALWWLRQQRIYVQWWKPGFDPWVRKIPWWRERQLTPVFLPGEFSGQRSLAGYSPWSRKDTTEWLTL